ncbi:hypothetical protein KIN20_010680 [Parelaphostrongylus tenuis]|uniref:Uncharacterized protein n=1 Tax=Parelaphostrongylus tenuis TaxID=148309 RepID=A0AAD5QLJ4_PARTN|nr:hypothetical protein KIN20_010680 [Parelaphostrongylus tenuis]
MVTKNDVKRRGASKTDITNDKITRQVLHVSPFDDEFSDITTTSSSNREHSDIPVTFCLAAYPYEQPGYNCAAQDCPPHLEERRQCIPSLRHLMTSINVVLAQWRHRIAATPAPLAQFDKETNIMAIVHTSV